MLQICDYKTKIPLGNLRRENCPLDDVSSYIYILQVVITKFTLLIGKTVNFELYIGGIGGGHL